MDINGIIAQLKEERKRIDQAIAALEGSGIASAKRPGRPAASKTEAAAPRRRGRKPLTPAQKKHLSEVMKARHAKGRKTAKKAVKSSAKTAPKATPASAGA